MKKILISIKNNCIIFQYKTNNSHINNDLINTNIISDNELIFSDEYIRENKKIISSFIKELAIQYNITEVIISKLDLANLIIPLLDKSSTIKSINLKEDEPITYTICELIINTKTITNLNCYSIQAFMLDLLDKHNIVCISRSEILYISNFMEKNNLLNFSNIYYKTNIRIKFPLSLEDLKDFEDFCKINKYLKVVHVEEINKTELENLIKLLIKNNKTNIKIVIHDNINNEKMIDFLKNLNKTYKKKKKIYLTLEYTEEYLSKNIFRQAMISTMRVCGLIISSLVILVITYIGISNYIALKQVNAIKEDLNKIIKVTDDKEVKNLIDEKNKDNEEKHEEEILENPEHKVLKFITNNDLASLLSVNEDVVGNLVVNNTNIEYPVVQAKDNDYYLDHNINKEKNANGWIFLDYRNDSMNLDKNNIIYGHNVYYSGVMFGTLYKTANYNWYTNPDNQIITFDTLYEKMKFKIFSIYRVPKTNDYLKVYFDTDKDFLDFINMVSKRSYYDFKVNVKPDDKILTLSTCSNNGTKRLVIHAVLINE